MVVSTRRRRLLPLVLERGRVDGRRLPDARPDADDGVPRVDVPEAKFSYDLSPMAAVRTSSKRWYDFVTTSRDRRRLCGNQNLRRVRAESSPRLTPSMTPVDGVAMPVSRRSTEPGRRVIAGNEVKNCRCTQVGGTFRPSG